MADWMAQKHEMFGGQTTRYLLEMGTLCALVTVYLCTSPPTLCECDWWFICAVLWNSSMEIQIEMEIAMHVANCAKSTSDSRYSNTTTNHCHLFLLTWFLMKQIHFARWFYWWISHLLTHKRTPPTSTTLQFSSPYLQCATCIWCENSRKLAPSYIYFSINSKFLEQKLVLYLSLSLGRSWKNPSETIRSKFDLWEKRKNRKWMNECKYK